MQGMEGMRGRVEPNTKTNSGVCSVTDIIYPEEARPSILLRLEQNRLHGVPFWGQRACCCVRSCRGRQSRTSGKHGSKERESTCCKQ